MATSPAEHAGFQLRGSAAKSRDPPTRGGRLSGDMLCFRHDGLSYVIDAADYPAPKPQGSARDALLKKLVPLGF